MSYTRPESLLADWQALELPFTQPPRLLHALAGGLTNRSFLLAVGQERYVLRLNSPQPERLGINRAHEILIHRAAAKAGLAPALVFVDRAHEFLISDYIHGPSGERWCTDRARLESLLRRFDSIARLEVPQATDLIALDYRARLEQLAPRRSPGLQFSAELEDALAHVQHALPHGWCHHDPGPTNVIWQGGRGWLLDWEYAAFGSPMLDLAAFGVEWNALTLAAEYANDAPSFAAAVTVYRALCEAWSLHSISTES